MKKRFLLFPLLALTLTACNATYFSTVFDWAYPHYTPAFDQSGRLSMNLEAEVIVTKGSTTTTNHIVMFETGFLVEATFEAEVEGITKDVVLTTLVDFAESGAFIDRTEDGVSVQHQYEPMTLEEIIELTAAVNDWETIYTEQLEGIFHDSLTDLAIGGATINGDVYSFNLPIGDFVDGATLEGMLGVVPTEISVLFAFNKVTFEMMIDVTATVPEGDYEMDLDCSNPGSIVAADYLLTSIEKADYLGYSVV